MYFSGQNQTDHSNSWPNESELAQYEEFPIQYDIYGRNAYLASWDNREYFQPIMPHVLMEPPTPALSLTEAVPDWTVCHFGTDVQNLYLTSSIYSEQETAMDVTAANYDMPINIDTVSCNA